MRAYLICIAVGVLLGLGIFAVFLVPEISETEGIETETKIEWVKKDTTIIHYKDSLRIKIVEVEESPEPEKYDSIRTYQGTERFLYGKLDWTIKTGGYLDEVKFKPFFEIPIKTVTNTITKTKVIHQRGLYAGAGINDKLSYKFTIDYVNKSFLVGGYYEPKFKAYGIRFAKKVF